MVPLSKRGHDRASPDALSGAIIAVPPCGSCLDIETLPEPLGKPIYRLTPCSTPPRGMEINVKPTTLRLKGFKGIFYAFGRDEIFVDLRTIPDQASLVAFIGPNGAGKTTILENLHPYRLMPSRATTLSPNGFSYWDVINGVTALKELEWEHQGINYRSVLNFRVSGKTNKADCYLYRFDVDAKDWQPVSLPDGALSDGKADTYDRCVEWILGPSESFFTAQFSSQKRKTIAEYDVRDIKSIFASMLNLEEYRALSAKANTVAKAIKQHLDVLTNELAEARQHDAVVAHLTGELSAIGTAIVRAEADVEAAMVILGRSRDELAASEAKRDSLARDVEERAFLTSQINAATSKGAARLAELEGELDKKRTALLAEVNGCAADQSRARAAVTNIRKEIDRLRSVLAQRAAIDGAAEVVAQAGRELQAIDLAIDECKGQLASAGSDRATMQQLAAKKAALHTDGIARKEALEKLTATASLIGEVPCGGTGLQAQCKLLVNAREAAEAIPAKTAELDVKRREHDEVKSQIVVVQTKLAAYVAAEAKLDELQAKRKVVTDRAAAATATAAMRPLLEDAERRLPALEVDLAEQQRILDAAEQRNTALQQQQAQLATQRREALDAAKAQSEAEVREYQGRLNALAAPVTDAEIAEYKNRLANANAGLQEFRARAGALVEQRTSMVGKLEAARALAARTQRIKLMAERCAVEIGLWKRLEKGLGNDGCVALSIDDAGPEIAVICNTLLKQCFNGRFVIRLDTQTTSKSGIVKETFEVIVFDSLRGGEGKLLGDMSGGEEVLVNECLTRAIALYASQASKQIYQTLFTDETDGALDPTAKRTFMDMKRAVLAVGGYEREYFITHTPELWALADHTVDVTQL